MTSVSYDPADNRPAGRFLRGLLPCLEWGAGLFMAVWIVELVVRPEWAYRKVVLAIWCAVVAGPTALYIGSILRTIWQDRKRKLPLGPAI